MSDTRKLASHQLVSAFMLQRPGDAPSAVLREFEARQIAELARLAHLNGRRFDAWPRLVLEQESHPYPGAFSGHWLLRAEVLASR